MTESDNALMLRVAREEIKRQAAEIERLQHWQRAVDDACTVSWVPVTDDARETVKALIARECQIALDPLVSSDAQALIDRGRKDAEAEIERLKTRLEVSPDHPYDGIFCRDATIKLQDERIAGFVQNKPVAWDVYESRIYGAPGEKNHRVLWVEHYKRDDGSTPDLDWLLNSARNGGLSGGKTIHVRPLVYGVKNED